MDRVVLQHQLDESRLQVLILEDENRKLLSEINETKSLLVKLHAETFLSNEISKITHNSNNSNNIHVNRSQTFTSANNTSNKKKDKKIKNKKSSSSSSIDNNTNKTNNNTIHVRKSHTLITPATPTSVSTVDKNGHRKKIKSKQKEKREKELRRCDHGQKRVGILNGIASLVPSFWNRQQSISKGDKKPKRAQPSVNPKLTPIPSLYKHNRSLSPILPLQSMQPVYASAAPPLSAPASPSLSALLSRPTTSTSILNSNHNPNPVSGSISTSIPTLTRIGVVGFGSAPETEKERESLEYSHQSQQAINANPIPSTHLHVSARARDTSFEDEKKEESIGDQTHSHTLTR